MLALGSPVLAGITVTSYSTVALTNAYAPLSQSEYFERQELVNVSPGSAPVSGDWMGPNAGGTTPTWHYVGSAQTMTMTNFDANALSVAAEGSFAFELTTSTDFVDPSSGSIFSPGAATNYNGFFNTDTPVAYTMTGRLNQRGRVQLNTLAGAIVFNHSNRSLTPFQLNLSGILPPGQYRLLITAGFGAPNLPNGVNHYGASGSYENVSFTVQVPEPSTLGVFSAMTMTKRRRRNRSVGAR